MLTDFKIQQLFEDQQAVFILSRFNVSASDNWYCHCRMCQKSTGSVIATSAIVPKAQLRFIKGDPKFYQSSEFVERGFCSSCDSPMFFRPANEDWISIFSGTLDDKTPSRVEQVYRLVA